jgi:cation diffusion facilitator family transporter
LFLLRGTAASRFRPSARFPFGRGKEIYFWSFMVAVVLFVGGGVVAIMEGYDRIRHPHESEGGLLLNLIVLGFAAAFEIFIALIPALRQFNERRGGRGLWRTIRESKDTVLLVVLFEDTVAVLGLSVAAAGVLTAHYTGDPAWDGIASITIGVLLMVTAWILAVETKGLLLGESATREVRSLIRGATLSIQGVETVEQLLTMHLGPDEVLVTMDLAVEGGLSGDDVQRVVDEAENAIRERVPEATRIFIEVGPPE